MIDGDKETKTKALHSVGSDHWPVSLVWEEGGAPIRNPFLFEQFWFEHKNFKELVEKWWEDMEPIRGTLMYQFQQNLRTLKEKICTCNKEEFGDIFQEKKLLKDKLEELQRVGMGNGYTNDLKNREHGILD